MTSIATKFRRLAYRAKTIYFRPENILLAFAFALCLVWTVSAISTMSKNWDQQRELEATRLEATRLAIEIETSKLSQEYYRSAEYKELVARKNLNKALEGETLILLPANSPRAISKYANTSVPSSPEQPSNFSEWLRFLFH